MRSHYMRSLVFSASKEERTLWVADNLSCERSSNDSDDFGNGVAVAFLSTRVLARLPTAAPERPDRAASGDAGETDSSHRRAVYRRAGLSSRFAGRASRSRTCATRPGL